MYTLLLVITLAKACRAILPVILHDWKHTGKKRKICKCVNSWNETQELKNNDILALGWLSQIHVMFRKREHLCLVSSYHVRVRPAARSRSGVRMKAGFSLVTVVSTPVISQWTMSVLLADLRPVWVYVYITLFYYSFFRASGWNYRCTLGLGSHSTQKMDFSGGFYFHAGESQIWILQDKYWTNGLN